MLKLQSFLNVFEGEHVLLNGTFDQLTFDAVSRFQNKYFNDILAPWGHTAPTGFVYILTKKKINEIYCNTTLALTDAQKLEISTFRTFLESIKNNPNYNGGVDIGGLVGQNDKGQDKGQTGTSVASTVADVVNDTLGGDALRNLAVSLFGTPKGLNHVSSTYLLILIAILLLAIFWPGAKTPRSSIIVLEKRGETIKNSEPIEMPGASIGKDIPVEDMPENNEAPKTDEKPEDKNDNNTPKGFKGIIG
jgi:hypothetical protein